METLRENWNRAIGENERPAHRAHMPMQHRRLAPQKHEPATLAAMALIENVILDDFHFVEELVHHDIELVGESGDEHRRGTRQEMERSGRAR